MNKRLVKSDAHHDWLRRCALMTPITSCRFSRLLAMVCAVVAVAGAHAAPRIEPSYTPVKWTRFVKVEGQSEPVPEQWLPDAEARVAYSLKLPESVPKVVPFDFKAAYWRSWIPGKPSVKLEYFNHLCNTEAGEWIFKKVQNVEGLYFARPQAAPTSDVLTDPFGPEMPWMQRLFVLMGDRKPLDQVDWLIYPPINNYHFVEQPRRETKWQANIDEPYIRLFGHKREYFVKPGQVVADWNERVPMQVTGIPALSARYGYTWRGLKRAQDREHGIAGGELIIYDMQTNEILAVKRQFLIAGQNPRGEGKAMWEVAGSCPKWRSNGLGTDFTRFSTETLQPIEPSRTVEK